MRCERRAEATEYGVLGSTEREQIDARTHGKKERLRQGGICGFGARLFRGGLPFAVCPNRYSLQGAEEIRHTRIVLTPTESGCVDYGKEARNRGPDCARCVSLSILSHSSV